MHLVCSTPYSQGSYTPCREIRKGWLYLLEAFYDSFLRHDPVQLLIRAHLDDNDRAQLHKFRKEYLAKRNKRDKLEFERKQLVSNASALCIRTGTQNHMLDNPHGYHIRTDG